MKPIDILIDFDGSVCTHSFPEIGADIGAVPVLKDLVAAGHRLILWTMRADRYALGDTGDKEIQDVTGMFLTDAVNWFKQNDIPLYGIQENPTQHRWTTSKKAYGQLCLDDINLGMPLITWEEDHRYPSLVPVTTHDPDLILPNLPYHERPYVDWGNTRKLLTDRGLLK